MCILQPTQQPTAELIPEETDPVCVVNWRGNGCKHTTISQKRVIEVAAQLCCSVCKMCSSKIKSYCNMKLYYDVHQYIPTPNLSVGALVHQIQKPCRISIWCANAPDSWTILFSHSTESCWSMTSAGQFPFDVLQRAIGFFLVP
jgi:hypothetical protein